MASSILLIFLVVMVAVSASSVDDRPFDCPANEEYYKCSLAVCYKNCKDLKTNPPCPSIAAGCYQPACECMKGYLRNSNGICVPYEDC